VVFSSATETSIIKHSGMSADRIAAMVMREYRPDVLIIEGFKEGSFPKVAVGKVAVRRGTVMRNPRLADLVRYVESQVAVERIKEVLPGLDCGKCGLDCGELANAIVAGRKDLADCKEISEATVEVEVGGKKIPTGRFVSDLVDSTVRGMLSALKGFEPGEDVEIRLKGKKHRSKRGGRAR
jgi:hypothetical protein